MLRPCKQTWTGAALSWKVCTDEHTRFEPRAARPVRRSGNMDDRTVDIVSGRVAPGIAPFIPPLRRHVPTSRALAAHETAASARLSSARARLA